MGTNLKLSELLQYDRKKGKKITFSNFTIFHQEKELAEKLAKRDNSKENYKDNLMFSVIFILKKGVNKDGINIEDFCKEKSILFLPFTVFRLMNIDLNYDNFTADIDINLI